MFRNLRILVLWLLTTLFSSGILDAADQANSAEERLRGMLRSTMLQLRDAQNQVATLQSAQAENDKEKKALSDRLDELTKQAAADKDAATKTITDLNAKVTDQTSLVTQLKDALEKWKEAYNKAVEAANTKEAQRAKFESQAILLQRRVDNDEAKNLALYKLGKEVLDRYEKFGLGTAITAREPFVGTTKVKLENLVQDYSDKLFDQTVKPGQNPVSSSPNASQPQQSATPSSRKP
ncbi:MAG: phage major capsid protein [Verrucomicrobia bacterium]|nr:phage major capsid protein [Verrucomicrobiota bacterium]